MDALALLQQPAAAATPASTGQDGQPDQAAFDAALAQARPASKPAEKLGVASEEDGTEGQKQETGAVAAPVAPVIAIINPQTFMAQQELLATEAAGEDALEGGVAAAAAVGGAPVAGAGSADGLVLPADTGGAEPAMAAGAIAPAPPAPGKVAAPRSANPDASSAQDNAAVEGVREGGKPASNGAAAPVQAANADKPSPAPQSMEFVAADAGGNSAEPDGLSSQPPQGARAPFGLDAATQATANSGAQRLTPALQIAQQIVRRADGGTTSFDLRLDPPEFGKVSVQLELGADKTVSAVISTDNAAALADLMRSARELERALQHAGFTLNERGLTFDLSDRGAEHAERDDTLRGRSEASDDELDPTPGPVLRASAWRAARIDLIA